MTKKFKPPTNKTLVALGISPATASEMMNRRKLPSLERAVMVEAALGVPPRWWVERLDKPFDGRRAAVKS